MSNVHQDFKNREDMQDIRQDLQQNEQAQRESEQKSREQTQEDGQYARPARVYADDSNPSVSIEKDYQKVTNRSIGYKEAKRRRKAYKEKNTRSVNAKRMKDNIKADIAKEEQAFLTNSNKTEALEKLKATATSIIQFSYEKEHFANDSNLLKRYWTYKKQEIAIRNYIKTAEEMDLNEKELQAIGYHKVMGHNRVIARITNYMEAKLDIIASPLYAILRKKDTESMADFELNHRAGMIEKGEPEFASYYKALAKLKEMQFDKKRNWKKEALKTDPQDISEYLSRQAEKKRKEEALRQQKEKEQREELLRIEEAKKQEEERKKEEERQREEELRLQEEARQRAEELRRQEEARQKAEELRRQEEARQKEEEERRRKAEEEKLRKEEEEKRRKAEEEKRQKAEEEKRRKQEEQRQKEEEEKKAAAEAQKREEEKRREEERKQKEAQQQVEKKRAEKKLRQQKEAWERVEKSLEKALNLYSSKPKLTKEDQKALEKNPNQYTPGMVATLGGLQIMDFILQRTERDLGCLKPVKDTKGKWKYLEGVEESKKGEILGQEGVKEAKKGKNDRPFFDTSVFFALPFSMVESLSECDVDEIMEPLEGELEDKAFQALKERLEFISEEADNHIMKIEKLCEAGNLEDIVTAEVCKSDDRCRTVIYMQKILAKAKTGAGQEKADKIDTRRYSYLEAERIPDQKTLEKVIDKSIDKQYIKLGAKRPEKDFPKPAGETTKEMNKPKKLTKEQEKYRNLLEKLEGLPFTTKNNSTGEAAAIPKPNLVIEDDGTVDSSRYDETAKYTGELLREGKIRLEDFTEAGFKELLEQNYFAARMIYNDYKVRSGKALKRKADLKTIKLENGVITDITQLENGNGRFKVKLVDDKGIEKDYQVYPDPGTVAPFEKDFNIHQGKNHLMYSGTCGLAASAQVINQLYGMQLTSENIVVDMTDRMNLALLEYIPEKNKDGSIKRDSQNNPVYTKELDYGECGGTNGVILQKVLEAYNIESEDLFPESLQDDGLEKVIKAIEDGGSVMMSISSTMLWSKDDKPWEEADFATKNSQEKVQQWRDGQVDTDHWINACSVVYDMDTGKPTGFIIKDTGAGEFKMVSKEKLSHAFLDGKINGKDIKYNEIDVIVAKKPVLSSKH